MKAHRVAAVLAVLLSSLAIRAVTPTLDVCAARVRDAPDRLESYMCYWFVARAGDPDGATRALEALLDIDPANQRARLYLAAIHSDLGRDTAEGLYGQAAVGFAEQGEHTGEVYARLSLSYLLLGAQRADDADRNLELASHAAELADDPILRARVWSFQSTRAMSGGNHGKALRYIQQAEQVAFPDGPVDLRFRILKSMGHAYQEQGLLERAREAFERGADLMARAGDAHEESTARLNVASLSENLVLNGRIDVTEVLDDLRKATQAARRVADPSSEALAHLLLARMDPGPDAIGHAERALEIYRATGNGRGAGSAMCQLALLLRVRQPSRLPEAMRLLDQAIEAARRGGIIEDLALVYMARAAVMRDTAPREAYIEASLTTLDTVEHMRDLQPGGTVGARLFAQWTAEYYRLSGSLLEGLEGSPDPDGDIDLAFRTMERMRARLLLDEMDGAGARPRTLDSIPEARRRSEVLQEIARVQTRLANPALPESDRTTDLDALERLETEEYLLRDTLARSDPVFREWRAPHIPTLDEVRAQLAADQAILSFQVALRYSLGSDSLFRGGGWVVAITSDAVRAFPLPDRQDLRERVGIFVGLCRRRDGSEAGAGAWLFEDLLAEPLRWMGSGIRRIVIVPDDRLHGLPFSALRAGHGEEPFGATHELSRAPSVTFWTRWSGDEARGAALDQAGAVLALADPDLHATTGVDAARSAKPWLEGLRLGALPHARQEARTLFHALGGDGRIAEGAEASERLLKNAELGRFRVLHFAAHAVVDDEHPDRSAVVLAPGAENEDGFLQVREIVDLDARGNVVILSACRSASGTVVRGGGMLGLGPGFLQAGARAVIGNLWPLRDDEAEPFVRDLGRSLARGRTLAAAVADARARRIAAGAPAAAWAGMVVLGDGDFVPFPGGRASWTPFAAVAAALFLLLATATWMLRRR